MKYTDIHFFSEKLPSGAEEASQLEKDYPSVLSGLFFGGAPPYCANIPPISVSEAAASP